MPPDLTEVTIQDVYGALSNDALRNAMIADDIVRAIESGRSPPLLTGRTELLQYFSTRLSGAAQHVFVLKGGMGKKHRRLIAEAMASVSDNESRVILATGSYIGEGFDDARLDTLFLAMPISWKGTLQQYAGRLGHALAPEARWGLLLFLRRGMWGWAQVIGSAGASSSQPRQEESLSIPTSKESRAVNLP